jgi:hypothetical protein
MHRDLVVLVADSGQQHVIQALLSRPPALGIREVTFEIVVHPQRDPGCYGDAVEILRVFTRTHERALVVFDRHGSGHDDSPRAQLEEDVERILEVNGWADRVCAVTIDPELEVWIWSDSPHVDKVLGWADRSPSLREWLRTEGLWPAGEAKPGEPKAAYERALREAKKPKSAALFADLAARVSTARCTDPAFTKLRDTLRRWFPPTEIGAP